MLTVGKLFFKMRLDFAKKGDHFLNLDLTLLVGKRMTGSDLMKRFSYSLSLVKRYFITVTSNCYLHLFDPLSNAR